MRCSFVLQNQPRVFTWLFPVFFSSALLGCGDGSDDHLPTPGTEHQTQMLAPILPDEYLNYADVEIPEHYQHNYFPVNDPFQRAAVELDNTPDDNPVTNEGATLGRVLFYDKKLSSNESTSCASCHRQEFGFSDPDITSLGFEGRAAGDEDGARTRRHSMGLSNARFYDSGKFFWDERAETLEEQALMPIQDEVEMGLTLEQVAQKVSEQPYYPDLFAAAFGDDTFELVDGELNVDLITSRMAAAMAQFQRSMMNGNSKYDQARTAALAAGQSSPIAPLRDFGFTADEDAGKALFMLPRRLTNPDGIFNGDIANCAGCHITEAFVAVIPPFGTVPGFTNTTVNGLDTDAEAAALGDLGVAETTGLSRDEGKFKVPSLVNIGIRPPYMHDGRFSTLEEVVDHYSSGIELHSNLVAPLRGSDGEPVRYNFTEMEKAQLVAFLNTLTDESFLTDERWSDPFPLAVTTADATEKVNGFLRLIDPLDTVSVDSENPAHYCIDVFGVPGGDLDLDADLRAHSCKIGERITEDQEFQFNYRSRQAYLKAYDLCIKASARSTGASIVLEDCADLTLQSMKFNDRGQLQMLIGGSAESDYCIAVTPGDGALINPAEGHLMRGIELQLCDEVDLSLSQWEIADAVTLDVSDLELESPVLTSDEYFPLENTRCEQDNANCWEAGCTGENVSPELSWSGAPEDTQAYALIMNDADPFPHLHWVVYGMGADARGLDENVSAAEDIILGSTGVNNGSNGYLGSCPNIGTGEHTYIFTLYALSEQLDLEALGDNATAGELIEAMDGIILDTATLSATYENLE